MQGTIENEKVRITQLLKEQAKVRAKIKAIYKLALKNPNLLRQSANRLERLYKQLDELEIQTSAHRCKRCGKSLKAEKSVVYGFGQQVCYKKLFETIPWVDLVEYVKEIKNFTQHNMPNDYNSLETVAKSLNFIEIKMLDNKIKEYSELHAIPTNQQKK